MQIFHKPVLLQECLQLLAPTAPHSIMVDGTLGEGGHTAAFLSAYPDLTVYGVDADCEIQAVAKERLAVFGERVQFFNLWTDEFFKNYPGIKKPNIILLDLGISVFHYAASHRGFSFSSDERLDMRLNSQTKKNAADIIATYSEKELADTIYRFAEERYSRQIARAIVARRGKAAIETAKDLADVIFNAVPPKYRYGRIHPATRTFQALRIEVNGELERLPRLLALAFDILADGGKLGVISFHSLEDRIVKQYFRELSKTVGKNDSEPIMKKERSFLAALITKKPVSASERETVDNAPSRSAKLRVIQKKGAAA